MVAAGPLAGTGLPPDPERYEGWKDYATALAAFFASQSRIGQAVQPQAVQLVHFDLAAAAIKNRPRAQSDGLLAYDVASSRAIISLGGAWKKLLTDGDGSGFLPLTGGTLTGNLTIENNTPTLRFHEADAIEPTGRWQFQAASGGDVFALYKATATDWSTNTVFMTCSVPNSITFGVPISLASSLDVAGATALNGTTTITSTTPTLRFLETDAVSPAGQYAFYGASTGDFFFSRYTAANWGTTSAIWSYDVAANSFTIAPLTKLATVGGVVEVGYSTGSQIRFQRTGAVNSIMVPTGASFRILDSASVAWASVSSTAGWAAGTSDGRLKQNVRDIHYGLDTIMALRPVEFDWIAEKRHDIGLIAQEVEAIIPEIVELWEADPDVEGQIDTYALRKDALTVVLIKAVQELTGEVRALRDRVTELEA